MKRVYVVLKDSGSGDCCSSIFYDLSIVGVFTDRDRAQLLLTSNPTESLIIEESYITEGPQPQ